MHGSDAYGLYDQHTSFRTPVFGKFSDSGQYRRPERRRGKPHASQNNRPENLSGVRVYYSGEGSMLTFETVNQYEFRYKIFDSKPELKPGDDLSDWTVITSGEQFDGGACRNIAVAAADGGRLTAYKIYEYVPGIVYYPLSDG